MSGNACYTNYVVRMCSRRSLPLEEAQRGTDVGERGDDLGRVELEIGRDPTTGVILLGAGRYVG
jgi:hypothetical protein